MNCEQAKALLEARLDGEAVPERELRAHLAGCPDCRQLERQGGSLQDALKDLPVDGPRAGFFDAALMRATEPPRNRRLGGWPLTAAAAGLVAGIALGVIFGGFFGNGLESPVTRVELVAGGGAQPVRLLFNAPRDLNGVELTLSVEGDVAIDGYGEQRKLSWRTDLGAGENLLSLPVRPRGEGTGAVVATLRHEGLQRTFRIQVDVTPDGRDGASVQELGQDGGDHV